MESTADRVRRCIREALADKADGPMPDSLGIVVDLGADSLDLIELVIALEDEFDIVIPEDALENAEYNTIGNMIAAVEHAAVDQNE